MLNSCINKLFCNIQTKASSKRSKMIYETVRVRGESEISGLSTRRSNKLLSFSIGKILCLQTLAATWISPLLIRYFLKFVLLMCTII